MKKPILLLLFFISFKTFAQYRDLYFEHLNVVEGLPESMILALHQDKLGYMWIGTQNGLVRYDGYKVKVYKLGNNIKGVLKDFAAECIYETKDGDLWVLSREHNLFRYNRAADNFGRYILGKHDNGFSKENIVIDDDGYLWLYPRQFPGAFSSERYPVIRLDIKTRRQEQFPDSTTAMVISKTGRVWLAVKKGLAYFDRSTGKLSNAFSPFPVSDKQYIANLYEAPSEPGILWFTIVDKQGKPLGLYSFDTVARLFKKFTADPHVPGAIASTIIHTIFEDDRRRLWFGTVNGLSLFDRANGKFSNYTPPKPLSNLKENPVTNIAEQADGKLWLATFQYPNNSNGLYLFDPSNGGFTRYAHDKRKPYSLNVNRVTYPMVDRAGTLWAGMAWGGVDRVNGLRSQFNAYLPGGDKTGYPAGGATGVALAPDDYCWFSSSEGLIRWKPGTEVFERVSLPSYVKKDNLTVYAADRSGLIWCGSGNVSLFTYDPKTRDVDTLRCPGKWEATLIMNVYQDHAGIVWIGTLGYGLYSFDKQSRRFTAYPYEKNKPGARYRGKSLDNGEVLSINEDRQHVLWAGTNLGGPNRYNKKDGTFTSFFDRAKGLACVNDIREDKAGRFWVGTYESGLFLFDRKTGRVKQFTQQDGLLDDDAAGIQEDEQGNLWLSCQRGFTRFNPVYNTFTRYTAANALPFALGQARLNLFIKTRDNELIFFSRNGIVAFYPDKLSKNLYPPQVQIETLEHNDPQSKDDTTTTEGLYGKQQVELPHNQNRISFNYVALHFENPSQNQYAYQLVGYDKNWVQAGTQRSVSYTNLSPASYTFRVKASNSDGLWNEKGASIIVVIRPPWWETWWALTLFVLALIGVVWAIVYYRSRSLLRAKHLLEQKVQLRTKEVLEQKEEIETQRDNLAHTLGELQTTQSQLVQREKMASLGELTAGIAHEIQNPLNFVNNFSEINTELIDELQEEIDKGAYEEAKALAVDIRENEQKIKQHGKRADFIVKGMLQHSRISTGEKQLTNINVLADEFFKLSYHGLRAKDKNFNAELVTNFDPDLPPVNIVQQDIGRVLLNLFNNAFYAVAQKAKTADPGYKPTVEVTTFVSPSGSWGASVRDNGNGIPEAIKDKIMQPFFTTKPTGEGTGLGLSLSYDIVVKGHGGTINIESKEGEGSAFTITLPGN